MKLRSLLALALLWLAPAATHAIEPGDYYVTASTLDVRAAPADGAVVNRLYRGHRVIVCELRGNWARVTAPDKAPRWVSAEYLSPNKPSLTSPAPAPSAFEDGRIDDHAIPRVGQFGLTPRDVDVLWRGAKMMLESGRCNRIELADKSVSKPDTYYVTCGDRNLFFTEADLR